MVVWKIQRNPSIAAENAIKYILSLYLSGSIRHRRKCFFCFFSERFKTVTYPSECNYTAAVFAE